MPVSPRPVPGIIIENLTRASLVCSSARLADTPFTRFRGLLGQRTLAPGAGLLITPSSAVHTIGMSMVIDVVALDRELRILKIWPQVRPGRIRTCGPGTRSMLELPGGHALQCNLCVGDQLTVRPAAQAA